MFAACAFWTMKITATMRTTAPPSGAGRAPPVQVRGCPPRGCGAGGAGGGAEPLAEGGTVVVGPCGAVMALLPSEAGPARGGLGGFACGPVPVDQCLRRNRKTSTTITMMTITPKLMNMGLLGGLGRGCL